MPYGRAIAQRIKGTLGITGLSPPRVHIDGEVWCLDVGSSHPRAGAGPKGSAVRRLKWHASWIQNVVRQFGPYPLRSTTMYSPDPFFMFPSFCPFPAAPALCCRSLRDARA